MEATKEMIILAIQGRGVPYRFTAQFTEIGLARFCGNQWNEDWCWVREKLDECSVSTLEDLYNIITQENKQ